MNVFGNCLETKLLLCVLIGCGLLVVFLKEDASGFRAAMLAGLLGPPKRHFSSRDFRQPMDLRQPPGGSPRCLEQLCWKPAPHNFQDLPSAKVEKKPSNCFEETSSGFGFRPRSFLFLLNLRRLQFTFQVPRPRVRLHLWELLPGIFRAPGTPGVCFCAQVKDQAGTLDPEMKGTTS